ncbi:MAG: CDP-alcohol phosphatidyltransferase family protein [Clostridioides difficile]|nr:CDP-alcohol phosphatidyltransferase family protein [Clostridioides sp.]MBS5787802.1 CDP-alcohol phosphatidyltransferase family protein [Clostridioides difficile]
MLDTHARKYVNPIIELGADFFIKCNLNANQVTIIALLLGISTSIFIYFDMSIIACIALWLSGYLDAVDGAVARKSKVSTSFGALLDILCDRIVEIGMILVLGLKNENVRLELMILLACILISMTVFLTVGALSEKNGIKSFYYQAGVAERSEGFILFSLMFLFQGYLNVLTNVFSLLILITIGQRIFDAKKILN